MLQAVLLGVITWGIKSSINSKKEDENLIEYLKNFGYKREESGYMGSTIIVGRNSNHLESVKNLEALMNIDLGTYERVLRSFPRGQAMLFNITGMKQN